MKYPNDYPKYLPVISPSIPRTPYIINPSNSLKKSLQPPSQIPRNPIQLLDFTHRATAPLIQYA